MTRTETNKLTMFHAVDAVLVAHQPVIDAFAPLGEAVTNFRTNLNGITSRNLEHSKTRGLTAAKRNALDVMADNGYSIANALFTLGRKIKDEELKTTCRFAKSDFMHFSEPELEKCCTKLLELAQKHATDLAIYKISNEKITNLQASLETYRKKSDIKDEKSAGSKAAREVLYQLFNSIDETLKEDLDRLMEMVKSDNVDFYNKYFAARVIKDIGGSHSKSDKGSNAGVVIPEAAGISAS